MTDDETSALRAVAHPLRLRILSLLTGTAMSAAEVARELGVSQANASYHLRILRDAGELVEAGQERIRGGVAKRYQYPHEPGGRRRARATPESQVAEARALGRELERRVRQRKPRTRSQLSDLEGWVPPEVWQRALELLMEASNLLHEHNRPPRTAGTLHVSQTSWVFEMTNPEASS